MSDYGLTVYNENNGLMFDSSRKMNSYVVTEIGTGTGPNVTVGPDDFVFVKVPYGQASNLTNTVVLWSSVMTLPPTAAGFFGRTYSVINLAANIYSTTFTSAVPVTLDYFVVQHSSNVSSTDEYGLVVYNEDQTVQFDSRSIKLGQHFQITEYYQTRTVDTWSPQNGGEVLGSSGDYIEISRWTRGTIGTFEAATDIVGLDIGQRLAINYFSTDINFGNTGVGERTEGAQTGTIASNETYRNHIDGMILAAVLT